MKIQDAKKNPFGVFKAPAGEIKGFGKYGKLGQSTGGLVPTVVKPVPGIKPNTMAAVILGGDIPKGKK